MTLDTFTILSIAALHDAFGFGQKRCQRYMDKVAEGADLLMDDLATWPDFTGWRSQVCVTRKPEKNGGESHMDKHILNQYIDACALIEEVEEDIRKLKKKKKTIVQTNVSGSNPDFPYNPQHFKIQGTTFTFREDSQLRMEEKLLDQRKADAEKIKIQVEEWMNTIPQRMQRIIRYKIFKGMNWQQVAKKMGRDATEESVRKEFERFFVKK